MRIIGFMNSFSQGISGGDACFIEITKRMEQYDRIVITSLLGEELCKLKGLSAQYLVTTREKHFNHVILTYFHRVVKALFLRIKIRDGDILYATSDFLPDVFPSFCWKLKNKRVKWIQKIFHLVPRRRLVSYYAQNISFFFIKRFADLIIVDNNLLGKNLTRLGFNVDKIKVNSPGVDLEYLRSIAKDKTNYDGVFLGRLHPSKGIFSLVEIWRRVCEENPKANLAIIGHGTSNIEGKLRKKIEDATLDNNIHVLGHLEADKAYGLIKASKIFVFTSFEEGFGMAICEAMACGVPVIAWDLPVYREIFPMGMIRIRVGNIEEFADNVIEILGDEEVLRRMAQEAMATAARYDWDTIADKEMAYVQSLL